MPYLHLHGARILESPAFPPDVGPPEQIEGARVMKMNKTLTALVATATIATGFAAVPAEARHGRGYGHERHYDDRYDRYDNRGYYDQRNYRNQRCDRGTGGTIIGAVVGGLAGREVARRGNRTEGAIIGAAVGALAGRAIDKSDSNCRRYR
jgi:outer membrane lipoprotein SlyB